MYIYCSQVCDDSLRFQANFPPAMDYGILSYWGVRTKAVHTRCNAKPLHVLCLIYSFFFLISIISCETQLQLWTCIFVQRMCTNERAFLIYDVALRLWSYTRYTIICISVIFIDRWRVTHLVKTYNIMWTVIFLQQSHFKKVIKKERDIYQWNKPRGACFTLVEVYMPLYQQLNWWIV